MTQKARIYRRTEAGASVLGNAQISLAPELYRVLQALHGETHFDSIRGRARELSDEVLVESLAQLERFGFVMSREAPPAHDLDFTQHFRLPLRSHEERPGPVERGGHAVRHVPDAAGLSRELKRAPPSLVFLDVMLGDGDGFEVLDRMRRHPALAKLPIVMLTAKGEAEDIARGLKLGADGYLVKPCASAVLLDTVRRVLKLSAS